MREKKYYIEQIKKIQHENPFVTSTEIAYQLILQGIVSGDLKPSYKLSQNSLADLFEMSRTPIREALQRLEKEKYISFNNKSGYKVHRVTYKEYFEFCYFRMIVESHAAGLAAEFMSDNELKKLKKIVKDFNEACDSKNVEMIYSLDQAFHECIVKGSHNTYITDCYESYNNKKKLFISNRNTMRDNIERLRTVHNAIFDSVVKGDSDEAIRIMHNHLKLFTSYGR